MRSCFWGVEKYFRKEFPGITTAVGYQGGTKENPTYKEVCTGTTGHAEVLWIEYDEDVVPYEKLVTFFYRVHDPTTKDRQAGDRGTQYRSAIFYYTPEQKAVAEKVDLSCQCNGCALTTRVPR
jgi:peptide-methionine (S)-S-oxide reductase